MAYDAVFDLLSSRYTWLSLEKFSRLTPANVHFLVGAAIKGRRHDLEIEASLHGMQLKPEAVDTAPKLTQKQRDDLDKLAQEQLERFAQMKVRPQPI